MERSTNSLDTVRGSLDVLWTKARRMRRSNPQDRPATTAVRRCSYCRQPGHYRPTCGEFEADLAELRAAYEDIRQRLDEAQRNLQQATEDKRWWVDEAFRLREENEELRQLLNSIGVSARPTRGR